jgi:hypothetical protein
LELQNAMKRAQNISEEIIRARHMITLNMMVVIDLLEQCHKHASQLGVVSPEVDLAAQRVIREHRYLLENISCLAERTSALSDQVGLPYRRSNTALTF